MAQSDAVQTTFGEQIESLPIGTVHDSATLPDGTTIQTGDIIAFDDRDIDRRDRSRGVRSRAFIGKITGVVKRPDGSVELRNTAAGRLDPTDSYVEVAGEGSTVDPDSGLGKFVDQYLNTDCNSMRIEWGTNLGDDGRGHRRIID